MTRWGQPPRTGTMCDVYDGNWGGLVMRECDHEAVETVYAVNTPYSDPMWLCGCCVERLAKQGRIRRNAKRRREPVWKCPVKT